VLAEAVERPELVDRRARSPTVGVRMRVDSYLMGAERLGVLVKKAIFAGRKPWWTTLSRTGGKTAN
jgi:hypothetical protein